MIQAAPLDYTGWESSFCDRVAMLLARSVSKLATSGEQREMIFRLRQAACTRVRSPSRHPFPSDRYDYAGNAYLLGLYVDAELASSIRLHVACTRQDQLPSLDVFDDVLRPKLDAGQVIIDCARFVADEHLSRVWRELPYATIRMCMLAAEHFGADYLIIAASRPHEEFYRRAFDFKAISEPRLGGDLAVPARLMSLNYSTEADRLYGRYPFFRSTATERRNLFAFDERPGVPSQSAYALM
jgi:N-acyl-L-homoserine lactone synthetase